MGPHPYQLVIVAQPDQLTTVAQFDDFFRYITAQCQPSDETQRLKNDLHCL